MVKNYFKVDNMFCYFMLFTAVSGYVFKMFCISVGMVIFICNARLKFHHGKVFLFLGGDYMIPVGQDEILSCFVRIPAGS